MDDMQKFIKEVHENDDLRNRVNEAGKALTEQNSKELRMKLASEMAILADQQGYHLKPEDFYSQVENNEDLFRVQ